MKPEIIVCGLGRTGQKVFSLLRQQGANVVAISSSFLPGYEEHRLVVGDLRSNTTLINAGIHHAHTLVLANNDDALNLAILTQARLINPQIRIINRLFNTTLGEKLDRTLVNHLSMSVSAIAAPIFTFAALGNKAIGQLNLYNQTWPIQEEIIKVGHPWLGKKLRDLWDNPNRMLIYYLPVEGEIDLVSAVLTNHRLQVGDRLIVGNRPNSQHKKQALWRKRLKILTNLSFSRRHARPVAIAILLLLIIIFLATLIYISSDLNTSVVDALYFSVGMITGAGGKEEVVEQAPDSIKIFTAIMMVLGAGVIGICYALINDFVLGSRFKQFWDAARIPSQNHYVICGLGAIGIQIVRQLHQQGYDVVVIESDSTNRFIHTARLLGVPVIQEDASLVPTLKGANITKAAAIIAVTSNDMTNLEIGLTARAIFARLPIIVRSYDPQFAQSMQEVFSFDQVLSPVELASHSFAAAALGGKILGNGMTNDLLWVALGTIITTNHPFCGKKVADAAVDSDFVPLYLEKIPKTIHSWELLETYLEEGDILYLTMPASSLGQLWRRTPPSEELILK
ncbi:MAG: potassium channel protein [Cyanobacteria bacterium J083]|nr:MAG: potassium channel protein [Cyanobacteria bacterium J083]